MKIMSRANSASPAQYALAGAFALLAGVASAASEDGHREHDAHAHGHGTLDIVVEGEELVVELRIPAVNLVGFEHAPRDDAEREAVRVALVPFQDAASVLVPPEEARCEVETAEAAVRSMHDDAHDEEGHDDDHEHDGDRHEKDAHEGEGHDDDHEHDGDRHEKDAHEAEGHDDDHDADGHDEHEAEGEEGAEAHSELSAVYRLHCHAPENLRRIEVHLFEHLRDAEEIDVRVVTETTQMAMALHPGDTVVELSP